eukprot:m.161286 g.161286  ORF g.161286 m.161286 type:complete len:471 (+) comp23833_c0_seq1:206-1618(+)
MVEPTDVQPPAVPPLSTFIGSLSASGPAHCADGHGQPAAGGGTAGNEGQPNPTLPVTTTGKGEWSGECTQGRAVGESAAARCSEPHTDAHPHIPDSPPATQPAGACPTCGEVDGRGPGLLRRLEARVTRGEESSDHIRTFVQSGLLPQLQRPIHHRSTHIKSLRKELSESLGVCVAVDAVLAAVGVHPHAAVDVVDLCCGKGLTAVCLTLRRPNCCVVAIDRTAAASAPHLTPTAVYLEGNVHHAASVAALAAALRPGVPTVVCGMHLCGTLSVAAIEIFASLPDAVGCVLAPCCLPSRRRFDCRAALPGVYGSTDPRVQGAEWAKVLTAYLSTVPGTAVLECARDHHILSERNTCISAIRRTKPPPPPPLRTPGLQPDSGLCARQGEGGAVPKSDPAGPMHGEAVVPNTSTPWRGDGPLAILARSEREAAHKFVSQSVCSHCGTRGHAPSTCWILHPEQRPPWQAATPS